MLIGIHNTVPPPADIHLTSVDQYHFVTFSWNPTAPGCSVFHYRIFATNCGICPSTTVHDTVTCVLDHVSSTITLCSFAVQSVMFCGDTTTGNISEPILVMLKGIHIIICEFLLLIVFLNQF
jgi:hypothetical protein